jgi:hypothetical protein
MIRRPSASAAARLLLALVLAVVATGCHKGAKKGMPTKAPVEQCTKGTITWARQLVGAETASSA